MRHAIRKAALFSLIVLVAACNQPITQRPGLTPEELRAEQEYQRQAAAQQKYEEKPVPATELRAYDQRLRKVAGPVEQAGGQMCQLLQATTRQQRCVFDLKMSNEPGLNASADGNNIYVTPSMVRFAQADNELAFVVAHEMAHNIMGHVAAQQSNVTLGALAGTAIDIFAASRGYDTGSGFAKTGAQVALLRYSPAYEHEADYVGLYILANAGYPLENVPAFWRKMSAANPNAIYTQTTHPTNPERFVLMEKTVREIQYKRANNMPLTPQIAPPQS